MIRLLGRVGISRGKVLFSGTCTYMKSDRRGPREGCVEELNSKSSKTRVRTKQEPLDLAVRTWANLGKGPPQREWLWGSISIHFRIKWLLAVYWLWDFFKVLYFWACFLFCKLGTVHLQGCCLWKVLPLVSAMLIIASQHIFLFFFILQEILKAAAAEVVSLRWEQGAKGYLR